MSSPVLLADGFVYEEADILRWLQTHNQSPCTNLPLSHCRVLRLNPLKETLDEYLKADGEDTMLLSAMKHASDLATPLDKRVAQLNDAIQESTAELVQLEEGLKAAWALQAKLQAEVVRKRQEDDSGAGDSCSSINHGVRDNRPPEKDVLKMSENAYKIIGLMLLLVLMLTQNPSVVFLLLAIVWFGMLATEQL